MSVGRRMAMGVVVSAIAAAGFAAPAQAATVSVARVHIEGHYTMNALRYEAAPGEANRPVFRALASGAMEVVDQPGVRLEAVPGDAGACVVDRSGHRAVCLRALPAPLTEAYVLLKDAGDETTVGPGITAQVFGGGGNEWVGNRGFLTFYGGSGNDNGWNAAGHTYFYGEGGNDAIRLIDGAATVEGGPGADTATGAGTLAWSYGDRSAGVVVTPDGVADDGEPGEGDDVPPWVARLHGGAGDDDLTAGTAGTHIWGNLGDNVIRGGPGHDELWGSSGDDLILGRGGGSDEISCGLGVDRFVGDPTDTFVPNPLCEELDIAEP